MRELVGGKNTIGRMAAVLKSPMKRPLPFTNMMAVYKGMDCQLHGQDLIFGEIIRILAIITTFRTTLNCIRTLRIKHCNLILS